MSEDRYKDKQIAQLEEKLRSAEKVISWYGDDENMSCPLKKKAEDDPACLIGDSEYFQDPWDLEYLKDGGKRARQWISENKDQTNE